MTTFFIFVRYFYKGLLTINQKQNTKIIVYILNKIVCESYKVTLEYVIKGNQ